MLYPKEDKARSVLMSACRHCPYARVAADPTVYKNNIEKDTSTRLDLISDAVKNDPTLPRTIVECVNCGESEAVFFMSRSGGRDSDMKLVFLCTECGEKWLD